jgi:hypothetical protein
VIRRTKQAVDRRVRAVIERLDSLAGRMERLETRLAQMALATDELRRLGEGLPQAAANAAAVRAILEERVEPVLRAVADDDAGNRRRLHALRDASDYTEPFVASDPLVSVTIATRNRPDLLVRALQSVLAQTHERLEVLVVGDAAGPEVAEVIAAVGDSRVHYANLTQRIVAHPDPERHRLGGSTMARNEATRRARGAWLLHFDDDDTLRPEAVGSLLRLARESRAEVVYGGFVEHGPQGPGLARVAFPPTETLFGWQGALTHRGLRFFERELVAAHLGLPGDIYLLRRMLRAGVRFALLDRVVWDYFPSTLWSRPSVDATTSQTSSTTSGSSSA